MTEPEASVGAMSSFRLVGGYTMSCMGSMLAVILQELLCVDSFEEFVLMNKIWTYLYPPFGTCRPAVGLLAVRVLTGIGIFLHGYGKLGNVDGFSQYVGVPVFMGWIAVLTEVVGGLLLVIGALSPFVSFALVGNMAVAVLHHLRGGDSFAVGPNGQGGYTVGWEFAALYLVAFFVILMVGPGRLSVDYYLGKTLKMPVDRSD